MEISITVNTIRAFKYLIIVRLQLHQWSKNILILPEETSLEHHKIYIAVSIFSQLLHMPISGHTHLCKSLPSTLHLYLDRYPQFHSCITALPTLREVMTAPISAHLV